jgi:hypothetical protein
LDFAEQQALLSLGPMASEQLTHIESVHVVLQPQFKTEVTVASCLLGSAPLSGHNEHDPGFHILTLLIRVQTMIFSMSEVITLQMSIFYLQHLTSMGLDAASY